MRSVALEAVAGSTKELQVVYVVSATARAWNNVIDREVAKRERDTTAIANAFLLAE